MKVSAKSLYLIIFTLVVSVFSSTLYASELTEPKAQGIIGERYDGYLGLVTDASGEIKALVKTVNAKRKARYQEIAQKRQQPLQKVEMVAGATAIDKTKAGNYIMLQGQGWTKK